MKRGFAILAEPANYTLDLIKHIYRPRGIEFAFLHDTSRASDVSGDALGVCIIDRLSAWGKFKFILRTLKSHDYFVLNGYTTPFNLMFILTDRLFFKKPYLLDSDTELRIPQGVCKRVLKSVVLGWLFKCSYAYGLAGGQFAHKDLFRHYGMKEDRIGLTPMMVDNKCYRRDVVTRDADQTFHFGYVGRLTAIKQLDKILQAYESLVHDGLNIAFDVVGDGEDRSLLEQRYGCIRGVVFHGAVFNDVKIRKLHRMDCLVLYSSYESWGLVVNEALSAGIPCIVSDKVGARNDLVAGKDATGIIVPFDDIRSLAAAMRRMVEDSGQYVRFQINAVKRMEHWDFAFYAQSFDRIVEKL